jgi:hypothetical protein
MKTLLNPEDKEEIIARLESVRSTSPRVWGEMSAHHMICHLSDSLRAALGEKQISSSSTLFKRTIYKWAALWVPLQWPHGIKTRPAMDQQQGGTKPVEFASDVDKLRTLFDQFCCWKGEFTLMQCSVSCRGLSGCGMLTFTWITTSGSSVRESRGELQKARRNRFLKETP